VHQRSSGSVLQCVAVCAAVYCSVLQCAAVCCSVLWCVTEWCSICGRVSDLKLSHYVDRKKPPPPGGFPIYYVPSSRSVTKRTPLEAPGTNSSRGVLLHTILDEGT